MLKGVCQPSLVSNILDHSAQKLRAYILIEVTLASEIIDFTKIETSSCMIPEIIEMFKPYC